MAVVAFNSSQFQSSIVPSRFCVLLTGGIASAAATTAETQAWEYQTEKTSSAAQFSFIFGENTEVIAQRDFLSGLHCTSAPVFLECNVAVANTTHIIFTLLQ